MTRSEMDQLKVGDKVEVRTYNTTEEEYEWVPTEVSQVRSRPDGSAFAHGGYHSVCAKVKGFTETLTPELTRLASPIPNIN